MAARTDTLEVPQQPLRPGEAPPQPARPRTKSRVAKPADVASVPTALGGGPAYRARPLPDKFVTKRTTFWGLDEDHVSIRRIAAALSLWIGIDMATCEAKFEGSLANMEPWEEEPYAKDLETWISVGSVNGDEVRDLLFRLVGFPSAGHGHIIVPEHLVTGCHHDQARALLEGTYDSLLEMTVVFARTDYGSEIGRAEWCMPREHQIK